MSALTELNLHKTKHIKNSILPKLLGVEAITLYPFVFYRSKAPSPALVYHECIHLRQVVEIGWLRFYVSYVLYWVANKLQGLGQDSYYLIPYEEEAFACMGLYRNDEKFMYHFGLSQNGTNNVADFNDFS